MISSLRDRFNRQFTPERYRAFLNDVERRVDGPVAFRLSETPCFFPRSLLDRLIDVATTLVGQLFESPEYLQAADRIVPDRFRVAHGEDRPAFIQVDFGFVSTPTGIEARLVELQAFPSLFGFQTFLADACLEVHGLEGLTAFFGGLDRDGYLKLMARLLLGGHDPGDVVLMEIDPLHQKTRADFAATERLWGIHAVDPSEVVREGRQLWRRENGRRRAIARIYNRIVPEELERRGVTLPFDYRDDLDVEWMGAPDWYFRISKFSIPWLDHGWVPESHYLSDLTELPENLAQWLLKPLFSFAGGGIRFDPSIEEIRAIPPDQRSRFLLQRRVEFLPVIETPAGPTQAEVRIMLVRNANLYTAVMPLVRMGRGKMMGVDHNKGLAWVGAAAGLIHNGL